MQKFLVYINLVLTLIFIASCSPATEISRTSPTLLDQAPQKTIDYSTGLSLENPQEFDGLADISPGIPWYILKSMPEGYFGYSAEELGRRLGQTISDYDVKGSRGSVDVTGEFEVERFTVPENWVVEISRVYLERRVDVYNQRAYFYDLLFFVFSVTAPEKDIGRYALLNFYVSRKGEKAKDVPIAVSVKKFYQ